MELKKLLVLTGIIAMFLTSGCAPKNPFLGKWYATTAGSYGSEADIRDVFARGAEIEIKEDGVFTFKFDEEDLIESKYTKKDDYLLVSVDFPNETTDFKITFVDGKVVLTDVGPVGSIVINFVNKEAFDKYMSELPK